MAIHPGSIWLDQHWDELEKFNNQWVVANATGIVESAETYEELEEKIPDYYSSEDLAVAFITFDAIL